ncbi:FecR family protein [Candidatus Parcubacteria bacterium]|nr:FecR family protein [Candidatus Parcubacteria bacterium]
MKKTLVAVAIVLILVVVGFLIYRAKSPDVSPEVLSERITAEPITVTTLEQRVLLKEMETGPEREVPTTATTSVGAIITTTPTGRALLEAEKNKTILDYNTVTEIKEHKEKDSNFLSGGAVWSRVEKLAGQGEFFEIQTRNAVAVVRGTSFGLWFKDGLTRLWVTEGVVSFFAKDPVTGIVDQASEVRVMPGGKASRQDNGKIVQGTLTTKDTQDKWFVYNNPSYTLPVAPKKAPVVEQPKVQQPNTRQQGAAPLPAVKPQAPAPAAPPESQPQPKPETKPIEPQVQTQPEAYKPLEIYSVSPTSIEEGSQERVSANGMNMQHAKSVMLGEYALSFTPVSESSLSFPISNIPPSTYSLIIIDDRGEKHSLTRALTITAKKVSEPIQINPQIQTIPKLQNPLIKIPNLIR